MREGTSPYRGVERAAGPRLVVHPLMLNRLLALLFVVALAPTVLYATLWSRTVTISCAPATGRAFRCETREEAVLGASVQQRELEGFRWTLDNGGRPRVEAVLRSGESVALFLAHGILVEGIVARLSAMLRAAHEE